MSIDEKHKEYIENLVARLTLGEKRTIEQLSDYLLWGMYGSEVFSQFGFGLSGAVFRHNRTHVLLTIKVVEEGVPLVAFVSTGSTMGCVEQLFTLLWADRLKWQKDKFPWI